jgi:hypothetical protein
MKMILLAFLAAIASMFSLGQNTEKKATNPEAYVQDLVPMSSYDSLMLSKLPPFVLPAEALRRQLPYMVDNSQLPYFSPLVAQVGLECGQSASIGVVFAYEINAARQAPGILPVNQYATHFTYNFLNGGSNAGINFWETYEMLKRVGTPSVADYGGVAAGGPSRWMSGYDKYYNSMQNRITDVFSIKTTTEEGLNTLKNWLYDHGVGDEAGGMAAFYANFSYPPTTLPPDTPEGGKHVITQWGNVANHAMSIVGFNDSIRWDYNGDGQYTNHLDINGDGIVDIRDWEIGGFKMANTYGSIQGWGDNGFAYMMYKTVADRFGQGGIWNNQVAIVDVVDQYEPFITAKVSITYPCRNKLKIMAGYADDPTAEEPDVILHFPIFDFQGGCLPMQGSGASETIEFGLDLNYLLAFATPGQAGKFFLLVQESDLPGIHAGTINSFSLMDYTGFGNEISYGSSVPIANNSITSLGVVAAINFDPVSIVQDELPPLQLYQPYSVALEASGGTPPYRWQLMEDYIVVDSTATMPFVVQHQLAVSNNNSGYGVLNLPFDFPFYGEKFNKLYVTVDGYIMFEESLIPWPFYIDGKTYFLQNKVIAPCMSHPFVVAPSESDGIWYEVGQDYVSIRWKLSVYNMVSTTSATFVARLHSDGRVEFFYGNHNVPTYVRKYGGLSAGDGENYVYLHPHGNYFPEQGDYLRFQPMSVYTGLSLTKEGILSGLVEDVLVEEPIKICVTDKNNLRHFRTFELNSEGVIIEVHVQSASNNLITFGDHFSLNLNINNINSFPLTNASVEIATNSQFFEIIEGVVDLPEIEAGTAMLVENAFDIQASNDIQNGYNGRFTISLIADEGSWTRNLNLVAFAPVLEVTSLQILDGNNGFLEPGEEATIAMTLSNKGGAQLTDVYAMLTSGSPYLEVLSGTLQTEHLLPDGSWLLLFDVVLDAATPSLELVEINLSSWGHNGFEFYKTFPILTGLIVEDFETGDLTRFDWVLAGEGDWFVTNNQQFEGSYSARSGHILDNQLSSLLLYYDVAFPDTISFYYKVSSELNYDFLRFIINTTEMGSWSGERDWTLAKYPVEAGNQLFVWRYTKDYSVSAGSDCGWIDYIVLPAYAIPTATDEVIQQSVNSLTVFPNPARDQINIEVELSRPSTLQIYITDMSGRLLHAEHANGMQQAGKHVFKYQLAEHITGAFFIIVRTNEGALVKKVIRPGL